MRGFANPGAVGGGSVTQLVTRMVHLRRDEKVESQLLEWTGQVNNMSLT